MKTLVIIIVFAMAVLSIHAVSGAISNDCSKTHIVKEKNVIDIPLSKAIRNPGLVRQMYIQLDDDFLNGGSSRSVFTQSVLYNGYVFRITGLYNEWRLFFVMDS